MAAFSPVTNDDLQRARSDPDFRQKMLTQNLELLLSQMQRMRNVVSSAPGGAKQLREGVKLAVRLAELIQTGSSKLPRP
jgi:hypothetical protein